MWESGAINDDSRYWDSESEEWKPIKELIEPKPPVLEEQPESGEEDWHVSNIDFPGADNPAPPVLKDSTPPKSKSTLTLISQIAFVIAGMALIIFLLPKIEFWRLTSEATEIKGEGTEIKGVNIVAWKIQNAKETGRGSVYAEWKFHLKNESNQPKRGQLWLYGEDKDGFQCYDNVYEVMTRIPPYGEIKKIEEVFFPAGKYDPIETWEIVWKQY